MTREEAKQILIHYDDLVWQQDNHITCGMISEALNLATEALNPWHKTSEELPKADIWAMKKNARYPIILKYYSTLNRWLYDEYGYTEEGVREYYDYFMEIPELPKED